MLMKAFYETIFARWPGGEGGWLVSRVLGVRDLKRWITLCDRGPLNWFWSSQNKVLCTQNVCYKVVLPDDTASNTHCYSSNEEVSHVIYKRWPYRHF